MAGTMDTPSRGFFFFVFSPARCGETLGKWVNLITILAYRLQKVYGMRNNENPTNSSVPGEKCRRVVTSQLAPN
ncbi:hypothetical protein LguiB_022839 [Lonicera macranthoides]